VIEYLTPFLDEMNGDAPSRVARACHVIDLVVREHLAAGNKPPSLRFIFHREIFWRRLDALSNPDAKPLTKAARLPVDAPKREKPFEVAKRPQSSPPTDSGPRVDAETMRRDLERLFSEMDRPASSPAVTNSAPLQGEKQEDPPETVVADELEASAELATTAGAGGRVDLPKEIAKLEASTPAAPSSETPAAEELEGAAATVDAALEDLAETERVRRAVWDRETQEREEEAERAEREKRPRWAERGELTGEERDALGVRSAAVRSTERRGEGLPPRYPKQREAA
jgi:hypothetical protein